MKKIINIAWKDLTITFRDISALMFMLVTPFAITLAIGFAFGGFNRTSNAGLADIPVVMVNHDEGEFGQMLVDIFGSEETASLFEPTVTIDEAGARRGVDEDRFAAAVIIPANFSESVIPSAWAQGQAAGERQKSTIEIYANPTRSISVGVVVSVVDAFISQVSAGSAAGEITIEQLMSTMRLTPEQVASQAEIIGRQVGISASESDLISVTETNAANSGQEFDWLTYQTPGMAIVFLMFTVTAAGRSILTERSGGTLPRLLVSPTSAMEVIGGKVAGIYLTGLAQVTILIAAGYFLFGIRWDSFAGLVLLLLALVAAATGWGMLLAAYARTPGQANAVGQALTLIFAAAAGNFVPRPALPGWLRFASYISPNAWGLEGFDVLGSGGSPADLGGILLGLVVMAAVLFTASAVAFRRQYA